MSTAEQRLRMASSIVNFEARRDAQGRLKVYKLPPGDGGGTYEVAGINDRYNKQTVDQLVALIGERRYDEAEKLAADFIAQDTDRAQSWTTIPALEFYLRDCVFNRGFGGAARILQRALAIPDDGVVGPKTRAAMAAAEADPAGLLARLRQAREQYERDVVHRDEKSKFWKGLVNRWNGALAQAKTFPLAPNAAAASSSAAMMEPHQPTLETASAAGGDSATLAALRIGMTGERVRAWQYFLAGQGFEIGSADGSFGDRTRLATIAFQTKYGLAADGVAGRQSLLKAASLGFGLIEEPADDNTGSNFPPLPAFPPLVTNAQRAAVFGDFTYVAAPTAENPEGIRILGNWERDNIVSVQIPQLRKALGARAPSAIPFHRLGAKQLQGLWKAWDDAGLLDRVLTFDGSFNARFVRGSRTVLSNHAYGSAFDINYPYNKLGQRPALVGEKGSVRELVSIANKFGCYWGGHYAKRPDGMHFEIAVLQ
ncbi:MAG TPA: M15 family metallopeptidase [Rhizomicrobium sp.]|nr:M15 family metallopeptidase [Rhizomicrobium sp.]